jgi:hypothetical protein
LENGFRQRQVITSTEQSKLDNEVEALKLAAILSFLAFTYYDLQPP